VRLLPVRWRTRHIDLQAIGCDGSRTGRLDPDRHRPGHNRGRNNRQADHHPRRRDLAIGAERMGEGAMKVTINRTVTDEYDTDDAIRCAANHYVSGTIRALVARIEELEKARAVFGVDHATGPDRSAWRYVNTASTDECAPAPQPHRQRINLNKKVRVKLTDFGWEILTKSGYPQPARDADGYNEWNLWTLMYVFGPHTHIGIPRVPFVNNEIILTTEPTP
jgi:hypothetical protein